MAHGCLPTRYHLQTCGVQCSDHCVMCDKSYENDWHVFFVFDKLASLWEVAEIWHIIKENQEVADGFVSLFFQLLEQLPNQQLLIFAMTLWYIWKRRNEKPWSDIDTNLRMSVHMAHKSLLEWQQARERASCKDE